MSTGVKTGIAIFVLAIIGAIVYFIFKKKKETEYENRLHTSTGELTQEPAFVKESLLSRLFN